MGEPHFFASPAELRAWFEANHGTAHELILAFYRTRTGRPTVTWSEAVDEALCVGWIDGIRRGLDDDAYTMRFTPRRPRSTWSAVNIAKVERLIAEGRMRPAGLAAWAARSPERSAIYSFEQPGHPELTAEEERWFRANETAWSWFAARPASFRKQALHWVITAKKPETRARRLATLIEDSAAGQPIKLLSWGRDGGSRPR